ncbi:hypothetical protein VTP01DRAFT_234 [Rhizomucor pusillus]|uniref:uncharacterized protein n=1 Tax=Rhizomucor pusillus TaxID=4840 RepID=UPI0037448581
MDQCPRLHDVMGIFHRLEAEQICGDVRQPGASLTVTTGRKNRNPGAKADAQHICAINPGARKLWTWYSPTKGAGILSGSKRYAQSRKDGQIQYAPVGVQGEEWLQHEEQVKETALRPGEALKRHLPEDHFSSEKQRERRYRVLTGSDYQFLEVQEGKEIYVSRTYQAVMRCKDEEGKEHRVEFSFPYISAKKSITHVKALLVASCFRHKLLARARNTIVHAEQQRLRFLGKRQANSVKNLHNVPHNRNNSAAASRKKLAELANRGADQMNRMLGYHLLPTTIGSFEDDIEDGLTSSYFDLEANLEQNDQRAGLKDKEEILKIMKKQKVSFDEARLIRQQRLLKKNNIDPATGLPLDPKFVTFGGPSPSSSSSTS